MIELQLLSMLCNAGKIILTDNEKVTAWNTATAGKLLKDELLPEKPELAPDDLAPDDLAPDDLMCDNYQNAKNSRNAIQSEPRYNPYSYLYNLKYKVSHMRQVKWVTISNIKKLQGILSVGA